MRGPLVQIRQSGESRLTSSDGSILQVGLYRSINCYAAAVPTAPTASITLGAGETQLGVWLFAPGPLGKVTLTATLSGYTPATQRYVVIP